MLEINQRGNDEMVQEIVEPENIDLPAFPYITPNREEKKELG